MQYQKKQKTMEIMIEGWTPSNLEQSLIDGTFDAALEDMSETEREAILETVPEDLLQVQEFRDAMEEIMREFDNMNEDHDITLEEVTETFAEKTE